MLLKTKWSATQLESTQWEPGFFRETACCPPVAGVELFALAGGAGRSAGQLSMTAALLFGPKPVIYLLQDIFNKGGWAPGQEIYNKREKTGRWW